MEMINLHREVMHAKKGYGYLHGQVAHTKRKQSFVWSSCTCKKEVVICRVKVYVQIVTTESLLLIICTCKCDVMKLCIQIQYNELRMVT